MPLQNISSSILTSYFPEITNFNSENNNNNISSIVGSNIGNDNNSKKRTLSSSSSSTSFDTVLIWGLARVQQTNYLLRILEVSEATLTVNMIIL
ncbi:2684_t:CDS:2, partial [Entrophospora sp. SA101]